MRISSPALALAAVLAVAPAPALSQTNPTPPAAAPPAVAPEALAALQRMGAYLTTLQRFEVVSEASLDLVTEADEKIDLDGVTTYQVRRPDAFVIDVRTDRKERRFIYDGSNFTIHAPERGYYATVSAPPTIREVLAVADDRYGIVLPLQDLFSWGDPDAPPHDIQAASYIGVVTIDGVQTDQYAFREGDTDWQIWIQQGDQPLPRKLVIIDRSNPVLPEFTARLRWDVSPSFDARTFAFVPGAGDRAIPVAGQ
jgi:hypothetical protein